MTTVAYKNGIMAADSGLYDGKTVIGRVKKIVRLPTKTSYALFGSAGDGFVQPIEDIIAAALKKDQLPSWEDILKTGIDFDGILVIPGKPIYRLSGSHNDKYEASEVYPIMDDYAAVGNGKEVALGVLSVNGTSAIEAVESAIKHNVWSKGPIHFERLVAD